MKLTKKKKVELLKTDIIAWNKYRETDEDAISVDLKNVKLERCDLSGANLNQVFLTGATLTDVNFTGASLYNSFLDRAYIVGSNFTNANLIGVSFYESDLTDVNFTNADLRGAGFTGSLLGNANFKNANVYKSVGLPKNLSNAFYDESPELPLQLPKILNKEYKLFKSISSLWSTLFKKSEKESEIEFELKINPSIILKPLHERLNKDEFQLPLIGFKEAKCPTCLKKLAKFPKRKTKCPFCKEYIFSRTLPWNNQKTCLSKKETIIVEAIKHNIEFYEQNIILFKSLFTNNIKLSTNDLLWSMCNKLTMEYASKGLWGNYSKIRLSMAFILLSNYKYKASLVWFSTYFYLGINGAYTFNEDDPKYSGFEKLDIETMNLEYLWEGEETFILSKLSLIELKQIFKQASERYTSYQLHISPDEAWDYLIKYRENNQSL